MVYPGRFCGPSGEAPKLFMGSRRVDAMPRHHHFCLLMSGSFFEIALHDASPLPPSLPLPSFCPPSPFLTSPTSLHYSISFQQPSSHTAMQGWAPGIGMTSCPRGPEHLRTPAPGGPGPSRVSCSSPAGAFACWALQRATPRRPLRRGRACLDCGLPWGGYSKRASEGEFVSEQ